MNNAFYVLIIAIMLYIYIYLEKPEKGYSLLVERSLDYGPKSLVYEGKYKNSFLLFFYSSILIENVHFRSCNVLNPNL